MARRHPTRKPLSGQPKVVLGLVDEGQEFHRMQAEDALSAAGERGLDIDVLYAENNAVVQIQQLYPVVHAPADRRPSVVIVHTVAGEGLERLARTAVRAGIGWILLNRRVAYVDELRRQQPKLPIGMVGADNLEIGRIQGRQFRALVPHGGLVLYIRGSADTSAAQDRLAGAEEACGRRIDLKVLDGQWTEASGEQAISQWLQLKQFETAPPRLIGCQNDAMAVGARRALQAAAAKYPSLAKIAITGVDGLPKSGRSHVDQGTLAATVIVPSNTGPAIRLVVETLEGRASFPRELLLKPSSYPDPADLGPH
ncbi:MAG TPA: substrate-binding domain-containing protein [Polyangia bacterium]|nr:substrate-binding domain-containing protein [Polyangia bacterium]